MDLNKIKETWQSAELKSSINADQIQKMLDKRGSTALERLVKYEKYALFVLLFCAFLASLFLERHPLFFVAYAVSCIIGFAWQFYKYELLVSIDVKTMDTITVSEKFSRYTKYISKELIVGTLWLVLFLTSYILYDIFSTDQWRERLLNGDIRMIVLVVMPIVIGLVFTLVFYRTLYLKNIRMVNQSIEELKSFEEEKEESKI